MEKRKFEARRVRPEKIYPAARLMDMEDKQALGMTVPVTIYVQDPLVADKYPDLGRKTIELDWEPGLMDGPTSARIAVVDYDADSGKLTQGAQWDREERRFIGADDPTCPQFHQVNVWAVIQNVLSFYENSRVLGRAIPWAFEGNRLLVVPHAGHRQNAYYDRRSKSLQFYYFGSPEDPVYTCLSHDIVAHETGHAILDGIRPYYNQLSLLQTAAFHEFLGDLTAILSALRNNDVRKVVAEVSDGDLSKDRVIGDLAEKFGQNLAEKEHGAAARPYLRTAHNRLTIADIEDGWAPHDCSRILTGAMFEILTRMALYHRIDKEESARNALWHATDRFTRIALRPLDYCPPVDVQFIDYARAMLHADRLAYPRDSQGYRAIIREVFHTRLLCSRSEEDHLNGLCDLRVEPPPYNVHFRRYDIDRLSGSRTAAYHFLHENRALLHIPVNQDIIVADLYDTDKTALAGRRLPQEIVLEYVWSEDVHLHGERFGPYQGQTVQLLCGGTLVFDGRGNVLSFVIKPGTGHPRDRVEGERRRKLLLDYLASLVAAGQVGLVDEGQADALEAWRPAVSGRLGGGGLQLEVTPYLWHPGSEGGG